MRIPPRPHAKNSLQVAEVQLKRNLPRRVAGGLELRGCYGRGPCLLPDSSRLTLPEFLQVDSVTWENTRALHNQE